MLLRKVGTSSFLLLLVTCFSASFGCDFGQSYYKDDRVEICISKKKPLLIQICSKMHHCLSSKPLPLEDIFSGKDGDWIEVIRNSERDFTVQLNNIYIHLIYKNNEYIVKDITTHSIEVYSGKFEGEDGAFRNQKKTDIIKPFTMFNMNDYMPLIYPKHPEYYAQKLKEVVISNKKIKLMQESEIYTLTYGSGFTDDNIRFINDMAFYLHENNKLPILQISILKNVIELHPSRVVAYLNLGDAYWSLGDKEKAVKAYKTYIKQMRETGKEKRIPKEILPRVNQFKSQVVQPQKVPKTQSKITKSAPQTKLEIPKLSKVAKQEVDKNLSKSTEVSQTKPAKKAEPTNKTATGSISLAFLSSMLSLLALRLS